MRRFLGNLRRWIGSNAQWIITILPGWVWGTLTVAAIVILIAFFPSWKIEDRIRYSGLALELLGVFTVAIGLKDKWLLFGRTGFIKHLKQWPRGYVRWCDKPKNITLEINECVSAHSSMSASIWRGVAPEATLENRVAAIQANLETLRSEHAETAKRVHTESLDRIQALDSERQMRKLGLGELKSKFDKFGADGLPIEATGLVWLVLGIVLATIPVEIASIF